MAKVADIESWMTFFGWTNNGRPGAVKCAYGGTVIARHGDAVWNADVNSAIIRVERDKHKGRITMPADKAYRAMVPASPSPSKAEGEGG